VDFDIRLRMAIYEHIAQTTRAPSVGDVAARMGATEGEVREGYARLRSRRVLVTLPDGDGIRMAPPFSGIPTQHRVRVGDKEYFANCAWDALGIPAALHAEAEVLSRCEQTREPLRIHVGREGPLPEPCVVHFEVPAAHWWDDIVHT
jgi:hypothetical protein